MGALWAKDGKRRVITGQESTDWSPEQRAVMLDWFRANGIVPENVHVCAERPTHTDAAGVLCGTIDVGVVVGEGEIIFDEFVRDELGRVQLRWTTSAPVTVERTVPMIVPMPLPA